MIQNESTIPSRDLIEDFQVERTIATSLDFYLTIGANPGGFVSHILWGDYQGAMRRAHVVLREPREHLQGFSHAHVLYFYLWDKLPSEVLGIDNFNDWSNTGGLSGAENDDVFVMLKMREYPAFSLWGDPITNHPLLNTRNNVPRSLEVKEESNG